MCSPRVFEPRISCYPGSRHSQLDQKRQHSLFVIDHHLHVHDLTQIKKKDDENNYGSIDGNSMVMMKSIANDDIQKKINITPVEQNLEQTTSSKPNQRGDKDNDDNHKLQ
jgi:hypothetical protein